ncbi:zinc finger, C3HC4 type (RING finger) protein (macronuclear) [Tetrahymena thermophila SB210]|uniref:Zinc finger, C3HC4 type (RING finger) protein n=1 Tax=Tetrahymena thermophila (strain SB210) TaxID=312017 RepID=I7M0U7_TETTS|nr:zinc finger, C3HC4 type (RING finger) protein [Tetrahymena thermophila SB210]EAR90971.2 zinc finger, C3HC4 type (RING finger) protein [Tetrahymena thermophila SB210]|eukprot:XP_001011216.2 zinc finger, C3HC4 type (RING finger) protein [Tetrahymena thermophila SB210]
MYIAKSCYIEVYSYYQIVLVCLLLIEFYIDILCIKVINQYIIIFNWESSKSNEEKYDQLKNFKVRQVIYKLVNKNQTTDILPLTVIHHKKMVVGAFALVFFTQFYFATNYLEFQCYFSFEPIVMNITFWILYLVIIVLTKFQIIYLCCQNNQKNKLENNFNTNSLVNQQSQALSVEQLEEQWKLRSTTEKVVFNKKKSQSIYQNKQNQQQNNQAWSAQQLDQKQQHFQNDNKLENLEITSIQTKKLLQNTDRLQVNIVNNENQQLNLKPLSQNDVGCLNSNIHVESHIIILQNEEKKSSIPQEKEVVVQSSNQTLEESIEYETCQICLVELQDGEIGREMKCCKKIFHKECCLQWFNTKETCPNCRSLPLLSF